MVAWPSTTVGKYVLTLSTNHDHLLIEVEKLLYQALAATPHSRCAFSG